MIKKHKAKCKMAFGKKDPSCARCQELEAGATSKQRSKNIPVNMKKLDKTNLKLLINKMIPIVDQIEDEKEFNFLNVELLGLIDKMAVFCELRDQK